MSRAQGHVGSVDYWWMLALMALGLVPRLVYFSGFELGDDQIFYNEVNHILVSKSVIPDNQAYRFSWWFPTALFCRLFGLILPFTVTATLGTALVYVLGKTLWGRPGGVIAALLLAVHPLDFAWSTMITNDVLLSFFSACTVLLVLWALDEERPAGDVTSGSSRRQRYGSATTRKYRPWCSSLPWRRSVLRDASGWTSSSFASSRRRVSCSPEARSYSTSSRAIRCSRTTPSSPFRGSRVRGQSHIG